MMTVPAVRALRSWRLRITLADVQGHWIVGNYVTASDSHFRWWMELGDGAHLAKEGHFHFCEENLPPRFMHLERFCVLMQKEINQQVPSWVCACKKAFQDYLKEPSWDQPSLKREDNYPGTSQVRRELRLRARGRDLCLLDCKAKPQKAQADLKALEEAANKQRGKAAPLDKDKGKKKVTKKRKKDEGIPSKAARKIKRR